MGLKIENSNAFEDVELKYDFKLALPSFVRGVATESEETPRNEYVTTKRKLGVQFTMSQNPALLQKKAGQLITARERLGEDATGKGIKTPVDDIVLVSLNLKASERYEKWLSAGKPPGGPEQYITDDEKKLLLTQITAGLPLDTPMT